MRQLVMIEPFAAARGNLSGKQNLRYPTKNNSAWDSPSNKRNYATNYTARYIGAVRSRDGKSYFAVKKRTAVTMSPAMRQQQAILGGTKAIYDALVHNPLTVGRLQALYMESPERNTYGWSMYKWAYSQISGQVENKIAGIRIIGKLNGGTPLVVQNPWISTPVSGAVTITISADVLAKFWMQLANSPVEFTVGSATGVAHSGDAFSSVIASKYNVLGLTVSEDIVKLGDLFLCYDDSEGTKTIVQSDDIVTTSPSYYLSDSPGA